MIQVKNYQKSRGNTILSKGNNNQPLWPKNPCMFSSMSFMAYTGHNNNNIPAYSKVHAHAGDACDGWRLIYAGYSRWALLDHAYRIVPTAICMQLE